MNLGMAAKHLRRLETKQAFACPYTADEREEKGSGIKLDYIEERDAADGFTLEEMIGANDVKNARDHSVQKQGKGCRAEGAQRHLSDREEQKGSGRKPHEPRLCENVLYGLRWIL